MPPSPQDQQGIPYSEYFNSLDQRLNSLSQQGLSQQAQTQSQQEYNKYINKKSLEGNLDIATKKGETKSMFKEFKQYIADHRDLVFSILLIMFADSFFLNGALRTKLSSLLHGVVTRLENKVNAEKVS